MPVDNFIFHRKNFLIKTPYSIGAKKIEVVLFLELEKLRQLHPPWETKWSCYKCLEQKYTCNKHWLCCICKLLHLRLIVPVIHRHKNKMHKWIRRKRSSNN